MGYIGRRVGGGAETKDLFVLGGDSRERLGAEVGELIDRGVCLREAVFEFVDICLEPFDLCCLRF